MQPLLLSVLPTDLGCGALGGWRFQVSQVPSGDAHDDSVTHGSPSSALNTGHGFRIQARGLLPCFFFFLDRDSIQ